MTTTLRDDSELQTLATEVARYTNITQITTAAEYAEAGQYLRSIKSAISQIENKRTQYTKPLNESLRAINADAKAASAPWEAAERNLKTLMLNYISEQERIKREQQRRLDEEARKERERLAAQAAKAEAAGKLTKAESLQERAAQVVAPIVQTEAPKLAGTSIREVWKFEITKPDEIPREYLMVDEAKIRKVVSAMKGDTNIPGIRAYPDKQLAAGAA